MLKVIILGLPRSGTTFIYKKVCEYMKQKENAICLLEPTNFEVLDNIVHGRKHVHDVVGEVPNDYDKLPRSLVEKMYINAHWHTEWIWYERPTAPFCGADIMEILRELHEDPRPIVIKDVHLWVKIRELYAKFPEAKYILTLPDFQTYIKEIETRAKTINIPLDLAGIGKFYRFYTGLPECPQDIRRLTKFVYARYLEAISRVMHEENVYVLQYRGKITDEEIRSVLKWLEQ